MKKFIVKSYQLLENKKWIPCGAIIESNNNSSVEVKEDVEFRNEEFETKEEADKFFVDYWTVKGYSKN